MSMNKMLHMLMMFALVSVSPGQENAVDLFYADRMAEFNRYLDARARTARSAAEKKAVENERALCKRRMDEARKGYTGFSEEDRKFWAEIQGELSAVLNLWARTPEADAEEKERTRAAAQAAMDAAQRCYEAQMRFVMAQLGMVACSQEADTVQECKQHFCNELRREYRQDFQNVLFAVPWGIEVEEPEEELPGKAHTPGSEDDEEGTVDLQGEEDELELLNTPVAPLMVHELAHETEHTDEARAAAAARASRLWHGYLSLCAQQVVECFGTERGASLVSGMPLPGAVEQSHFLAVQEHTRQLFIEAENAWQAYVEAVVAAYDAAEQRAGSPASAEAQLLRFPLYSTHEQYLAFVIAPHLQYVEPAPMPEIGSAE